jgi:hypothetical protein
VVASAGPSDDPAQGRCVGPQRLRALDEVSLDEVLLDELKQRVTHQHVGFLDSRCVLGGHPQAVVDGLGQLDSRAAGQTDGGQTEFTRDPCRRENVL